MLKKHSKAKIIRGIFIDRTDRSTSRRALKVWAHLKEHGVAALATAIDRNIEQAQYLEQLVKASDKLEMLAPVPLNICCFRYKFDTDCDALNEEIVVQLQESGIAVPSTTVLGGQLAIRVNLTNHRTRESDLDMLVAAVLATILFTMAYYRHHQSTPMKVSGYFAFR